MKIGRRSFLATLVAATAASTVERDWKAIAANGSGWPAYSYDTVKTRNNPSGESLPDDLTGLNEIWVSDGPSNSDPVVANETVYVGFEDNVITALDYRTGNEAWSYSTTGGVSTPLAVDEDTVYGGDTSGKFYSIDASTGELNWNTSLDGGVTTGPMVTPTALYVGTEDGLFSLDPDNGNVNWSRSTNVSVEMSPVFIDDEDLLLFADGGDMYGLNPFTGAQEWHQYIGGSITEVVASGTRAYAIAGSIHTFFVGNGSDRWTHSPRGDAVDSPVIYDGNMYIGTTEGRIEKLDLNQSGVRDWATKLGGEIRRSPLVVDGVLYAISAESSRSEDVTLHAVDPNTGDQLGQKSIGHDVNRGPTVAHGKAYLSAESGVYGYSAGSGLVASFNIEPSSPSAGETVTFDAAPTTEGLNQIQSYSWEFASGSESFEESGTVVEHTFESGGNWEATLTVTDSEGNSDTTAAQITVTGVASTAEGEAVQNETTNDEGNETAEDDPMFGFIPTSMDQIPTQLGEVPREMTIAAAGVGSLITAGVGFLLYRRRSTVEETQAGTTCPSCGSDIGKGKKFCPSCGVDVAGGEKRPTGTDTATGTSNTPESEFSQEESQPTPYDDSNESVTVESQNMDAGLGDEETEQESMTEPDTKEDAHKESRTCPECDSDIDSSLSFCTSCGASLDRE